MSLLYPVIFTEKIRSVIGNRTKGSLHHTYLFLQQRNTKTLYNTFWRAFGDFKSPDIRINISL